MCGIFGYIGDKNCVEIVYAGLSKLEYRGYDSAGICVYDSGKISCVKEAGKLINLRQHLETLPAEAKMGMGHTRWATHGMPVRKNAHPHTINASKALVHNGIFENFKALLQDGVDPSKLKSETDSEVFLHFLAQNIDKASGDVIKGIIDSVEKVDGAFAVAYMDNNKKVGTKGESFYVFKHVSPIAVGKSEHGIYFASDGLSLADSCTEIHYLEDGEIAVLNSDMTVELYDFKGRSKEFQWQTLNLSPQSFEKKGYKHFMLKEIHEQSLLFSESLGRIFDLEGAEKSHKLNSSYLGLENVDLKKVKNIYVTACGTAYYACLTAKYLLEPLVGLPVHVELASEMRYRQPLMDESTLLIAVTQSGETVDTLACVKYAKSRGGQVYAVCNVVQSSIPRESHGCLYMNAGPEIGVASTKAFTSMIMNLFALGMHWGSLNGNSDTTLNAQFFDDLKKMPHYIESIVDDKDKYKWIAERLAHKQSTLFIGRGVLFPIALEGALKLKEISYIHAEAYAGGELKHGPIALVDGDMPIISLLSDTLFEKMLGNIEEVIARKGEVFLVTDCPEEKIKSHLKLSDETILRIPSVHSEVLKAVLFVIPLQLISYYTAVHRGTDVDQPRNLAKSVTVE